MIQNAQQLYNCFKNRAVNRPNSIASGLVSRPCEPWGSPNAWQRREAPVLGAAFVQLCLGRRTPRYLGIANPWTQTAMGWETDLETSFQHPNMVRNHVFQELEECSEPSQAHGFFGLSDHEPLQYTYLSTSFLPPDMEMLLNVANHFTSGCHPLPQLNPRWRAMHALHCWPVATGPGLP